MDRETISMLNHALESEDDKAFLKSISILSRQSGISNTAKKTNLGRSTLYHALSEKGNPSWSTIRKVCASLGLVLSIRNKKA